MERWDQFFDRWEDGRAVSYTNPLGLRPRLGEFPGVGVASSINDDLALMWDVLTQPWQSFSPSGYSGITVGNGTVTAFRTQIGGRAHGRYRLLFGSTTAISSSYPQIWGLLPDANHGVQWATAYGFNRKAGVLTSNPVLQLPGFDRFQVAVTTGAWTTGDEINIGWACQGIVSGTTLE